MGARRLRERLLPLHRVRRGARGTFAAASRAVANKASISANGIGYAAGQGVVGVERSRSRGKVVRLLLGGLRIDEGRIGAHERIDRGFEGALGRFDVRKRLPVARMRFAERAATSPFRRSLSPFARSRFA